MGSDLLSQCPHLHPPFLNFGSCPSCFFIPGPRDSESFLSFLSTSYPVQAEVHLLTCYSRGKRENHPSPAVTLGFDPRAK